MGGFIEELDFYLADTKTMIKRINKQIKVLKEEDEEDYQNIIQELRGFIEFIKEEKESRISVQYYVLNDSDLTGMTIKNVTDKLLDL